MSLDALPTQVKKALSMLETAGFEGYIVGGCVRDSLMGNTPEDYDITTSALPNETEEIFSSAKIIETGLKHGTITVILDSMPLEITTYRLESTYSDKRHPDSVSFTKSLYEDVARRDFTMNSIAYNQKNGIVDYFGGQEDIKRGIIRCVGDADKRFSEDALRMMRALRFSSVLGFEIEEDTKRAIFKNKELLENVSNERIAAELKKLLCGKDARRIIMEYVEVLGIVIPELLPMRSFEQRNQHHIYDVLEHSAIALENVPPEPELRLAALLHDVGKPRSFRIDDNGVGHFYGHAKLGSEMTGQILRRLRFDNETRILVKTLVEQHDLQIEPTPKAVKRALGRLGQEIFSKLILLKRADNLAQNPLYRDRQGYYDELERIAAAVIASEECFSLKSLALNGSDLIAMGMKPGAEIGEVLAYLLDAVINDAAKNEKEELMELVKRRLAL